MQCNILNRIIDEIKIYGTCSVSKFTFSNVNNSLKLNFILNSIQFVNYTLQQSKYLNYLNSTINFVYIHIFFFANNNNLK